MALRAYVGDEIEDQRTHASGTPSIATRECFDSFGAPRLKPRGAALPPMFGSSPNNGFAFFWAVGGKLLLLLLLPAEGSAVEPVVSASSLVASSWEDGPAPMRPREPLQRSLQLSRFLANDNLLQLAPGAVASAVPGLAGGPPHSALTLVVL